MEPLTDGWLTRLDPRTKLWIMLLGIVICLITLDLPPLVLAVAIANIVLLSGGMSAPQILGAWRGLAPLIVIIVVLQPLFVGNEGRLLLQIGPVYITDTGLLRGAGYALRLVGAAFFVLIPVATTPINTLVHGLNRVGLPYNWGLVIGLALRYLTTLGDLFTTISQAQQARGLDLDQRGLVKRVRMVVPTVIALLIASLRLTDSLAIGLAARGFGMQGKRTVWHVLHMQRADWIAIAASTGVFASVLCGNVRVF